MALRSHRRAETPPGPSRASADGEVAGSVRRGHACRERRGARPLRLEVAVAVEVAPEAHGGTLERLGPVRMAERSPTLWAVMVLPARTSAIWLLRTVQGGRRG